MYVCCNGFYCGDSFKSYYGQVLNEIILNPISGLRGFEIFISDKNEYQEESLETFLMYVIDEMNAELGVIDSSEPVRSVSVKNYMSENLSKQWLGVLYTLCSLTVSQCISMKIQLSFEM